MSAAAVCGKRSSPSSPSSSSYPFFDELLFHTPPPAPKRLRRAAAASAFGSSAPQSLPSPVADRRESDLAQLRSLFPQMDQQILERALEESGNDLDVAIRSLHDLRLQSAEIILRSAVCSSENEMPNNSPVVTEGISANNGVDVGAENLQNIEDLPKDGSEWVELLVREMMNASNMDDARARASRVLDLLEKSIVARAGTELMQSSHKENMVLKEQAEELLRQNAVLRRAVAIQHERHKDYDERNQELQQLKQLVSQYQEQIKTLEVNNYALGVHLRQAQQSSSIPGCFHPDVF
ncbi:hypothetical protein ACMD2_17415 [Ananas comosus]|uniref:CUE domain-containing protein n=1 Tax=Ananas comosus TaxID=4615 RepID=A0A199VYU1_ANACO|nr:hypothetical protein ACMD2_17415 [Ananas comosus]